MSKILSAAKNRYKKAAEAVAALFLALAVGGIFFMVSGYNPFQVYWLILKGAFGSGKSFLTTLHYATPLVAAQNFCQTYAR